MSAKNIHELNFTKIEIKILKYIFKHYKEKYNARQLARILLLNHANVNKLCNSLAKKNLLMKEEIGNSIYYNFDYQNNLALNFIEYLLSLEINEFPKHLQVLLHNLKKFNNQIQLGLVFGSSIKSTSYNDIDIFLMYDKKKTQTIENIKEEIKNSELVEKPIIYVEISEKDILENKENKAFQSLISDNLIFHNPSKYIEVIKWLRQTSTSNGA
jgi:predicted transcriptional regulator